MSADEEQALALLETLSQRLDALSARGAAAFGARLTCRHACTGCCQREVSVFPVEAERLRRALAQSPLADPRPAAMGCPMLGPDGGCRVYAARPSICRSHGLPIRFRADAGGEARDVCPLNRDAGLDPWDVPAEAVLNIDVLNTQLVAINRLFGHGDARVGVGSLLPSAS